MSSLAYLRTATIDEVLDSKTGLVVKAQDVVKNEDEAILLRTRLMEGIENDSPLYLCPVCFKPIYLRSNVNKTGQSFVHRDVEGNCPKLQEKGISEEQIRAMKYQGAKESLAHKETKQLLISSLKADASFSEIMEERNWMSRDQKGKYRRPDVQAVFTHNGTPLRIAFEIQLSSTFLTEIVQRREFYRKEGALLVWVFRNFVRHDPNLTQLDIFYPNNLNAFVVNPKTLEHSLQAKRLQLECFWAEPKLQQDTVVKSFKNQAVDFTSLKLDQERQQAYFCDYFALEEELFQELQGKELKALVAQFREYCKRIGWKDSDHELASLRNEFSKFNFTIPQNPSKLLRLAKSLYSLEKGKSVGMGYDNLIQYANNLYEHSPEDILFFLAASNVYQRKEVLEEQGNTRKWRKKKATVWSELKKGPDSKYQWQEDTKEIIFLLFPIIKGEFIRLVSLLKQEWKRARIFG